MWHFPHTTNLPFKCFEVLLKRYFECYYSLQIKDINYGLKTLCGSSMSSTHDASVTTQTDTLLVSLFTNLYLVFVTYKSFYFAQLPFVILAFVFILFFLFSWNVFMIGIYLNILVKKDIKHISTNPFIPLSIRIYTVSSKYFLLTRKKDMIL